MYVSGREYGTFITVLGEGKGGCMQLWDISVLILSPKHAVMLFNIIE